MLDQINDAIDTAGGEWLKCYKKEHGVIEGEILDIEVRDRRDNKGETVYKRGTDKPRKVWTITLRVDADKRDGDTDDGNRKIDLNESGQRAFAAAVKAAKAKVEVGGRLQFRVKEEAADSYSQAQYAAKYTPPAKTIDLPDTDTGGGGDDFDF